jgi:hypothetical protein
MSVLKFASNIIIELNLSANPPHRKPYSSDNARLDGPARGLRLFEMLEKPSNLNTDYLSLW